MAGVPIETIKEVNSTHYEKLKGMMPMLSRFGVYSLAKNLGVRYKPEDLDIFELHIFSSFQEEIDARNSKKGNGWPTKN